MKTLFALLAIVLPLQSFALEPIKPITIEMKIGKHAVVHTKDIAAAVMSKPDDATDTTIELQLGDKATKRFSKATKKAVKKKLEVFIDGKEDSSSVIQEAVTDGKIVLVTSGSRQDAELIVGRINEQIVNSRK